MLAVPRGQNFLCSLDLILDISILHDTVFAHGRMSNQTCFGHMKMFVLQVPPPDFEMDGEALEIPEDPAVPEDPAIPEEVVPTTSEDPEPEAGCFRPRS